jgi:hypothetical protein
MFWMLVSAAAECDGTVATETVERDALAAQAAFGALDPPVFQQSYDAVVAGVPCVREPLSPGVVAQVHVLGGLRAFLDSDEVATAASFQAAQAADPELELGPWLPDAHPVRLDWRFAERLEQDPAVDLDPKASVLVDGMASHLLVLGRPAVLQHLEDGVVTETLWWQGGPLPEWAPIADPVLTPQGRRRLILSSGALAAAGASATFTALSYNAHAEFTSGDADYDDLDDLADRANRTGAAAVATGALSVGLVVVLAATWSSAR